MVSVCVDAQNCVTGVCPDNLAGGSGWNWIETNLTPSDNLTDDRGVALFKLVGGKIIPRTQAEMMADDSAKTTAPLPTIEERVAKVETVINGTPPLVEMIEALNILLGE